MRRIWLVILVLAFSLGLYGQSTIKLGGKKTVASAGTAVQLTTTVNRAQGVYIEADEDNTGVIFIGTSAVTGDSYIASLNAGEGFSWTAPSNGPAINVTAIYIDSDTNTQSVQWGYW